MAKMLTGEDHRNGLGKSNRLLDLLGSITDAPKKHASSTPLAEDPLLFTEWPEVLGSVRLAHSARRTTHGHDRHPITANWGAWHVVRRAPRGVIDTGSLAHPVANNYYGETTYGETKPQCFARVSRFNFGGQLRDEGHIAVESLRHTTV
jgi:hypothetical protein